MMRFILLLLIICFPAYAGLPPVAFKNAGSLLTPLTTSVNCSGAGVTCTNSAGAVTITVSGSGSGASAIEAHFALNDAIVPYVNIDGPHYQANTKTLSIVNLSMLDSGSAGTPVVNYGLLVGNGYSTVIQINQYHAGNSTVFATGCAAIPGLGGKPNSIAATVFNCTTGIAAPMTLAIGDIETVDIKSVGPSTFPYGTPDSIGVEW